MYLTIGEFCARILRSVVAVGLACCALSQADCSVANATFISHGSQDVHIRVVDKHGPIRVRDAFLRHGEGGLPSLNLYEKFYATDDDAPGFWADVDIEVTLRLDRDHYGFPSGDWFNNYFDHGWGNDPHGGPHNDPVPESIDIGIDKFVKNKTRTNWDNFRIELGTRDDSGEFVQSGSQDDLYFTTAPMTKEVTSFYNDPPSLNPDTLQWTADGSTAPGQAHRDRAIFWFGVHVPAELFEEHTSNHGHSFWHSHHENVWKAQFTIRQHVDIPIDPDTNVPEPTTTLLAMVGVIASFFSRKIPKMRQQPNYESEGVSG